MLELELPRDADKSPDRPAAVLVFGERLGEVEEHRGRIGCHPFPEQPAGDVLLGVVAVLRGSGNSGKGLRSADLAEGFQEHLLGRGRSGGERAGDGGGTGFPVGHADRRCQERLLGIGGVGVVARLDDLGDEHRKPFDVDDVAQSRQGRGPRGRIGRIDGGQGRRDGVDATLANQLEEHRQELARRGREALLDLGIDLGP